MAPFVPGPYAGNYYIGGDTGNDFQDVRGTSGQLVRKFEVWYDGTSIRGMRVTFTDSSRSQVFGKDEGDRKEMSLEPLERVTELSLWGNGTGAYTGKVKLVTTKQTFEAGKDTGSSAGYGMDVGAGFFAGIAGRADDRIRCSSLFFLTDIRSATLHDVTYPNLPSGGISPVLLSEKIFKNTFPTDTNWHFNDTVTRRTSRSFTNTKSMEIGLSITVGATLFEIAKVESTFSWKQTTTQSTTNEVSNEISLSWDLSGTLKPNESVRCISQCQQGICNIDYEGIMTISMRDNSSFDYKVQGTYQDVLYAYTTAEAQPVSPGIGPEFHHVPSLPSAQGRVQATGSE